MKITKTNLLQRITDVYSGAQGSKWGIDDFATAEQLSNIIPVLQEIFDPECKHGFRFSARALNHFDNPQDATDWLFEMITNDMQSES